MSDEERPIIETLSTREVYKNKWMRVREDRIRRPDGSESIYGVVEKPDFAVIAARDDAGRLYLVQQYRYAVGERRWEFSQGAWEHAPDADPLDLARGELKEETGLTAGTLVHAGRLFQAYGYATQAGDVYLATDLTEGAPEREVDEQDMISAAFPLAEVERMIADGEIADCITVAAFGLLRLKGLL